MSLLGKKLANMTPEERIKAVADEIFPILQKYKVALHAQIPEPQVALTALPMEEQKPASIVQGGEK